MSTGRRLQIARQANNISIDELAERTGLSVEDIQSYENDEVTPELSTVTQMAQAFEMDSLFLLRTTPVVNVLPVSPAFEDLNDSAKEMLLAQAQIWLERYFDLESFFPVDELPYPVFPDGFPFPATSASTVARAATELRRVWELGVMPVKNLTDLLENVGIRVGVLPDIEGFEACAMITDDDLAFPLIVFNWNMTGEEQRFMIARETAYFLLDGIDNANLAMHFAACFLLPAQIARYQLGSQREEIEIYEMYLLKHNYGISMRRAIARIAGLRIISKDLADEWIATFREFGWDNQEPGENYSSDYPQRMTKLALRLQNSGQLTETQAASLLGMNDMEWFNLLTLGEVSEEEVEEQRIEINLDEYDLDEMEALTPTIQQVVDQLAEDVAAGDAEEAALEAEMRAAQGDEDEVLYDAPETEFMEMDEAFFVTEDEQQPTEDEPANS